jgi:dipeptidyl aminopeptidase/acylaminoacyl peptidase
MLLSPTAALATFPGTNGKIAFVQGGDIWAINPNGSGLGQVTSGPAEDRSPAWSPDGTTIAFSRSAPSTPADPAPQSDIWFVRPGSAPTRFTDTTAFEDHPAWTPDGLRLSFVRVIPSCAAVVVRIDGGASVGTLPVGAHAWSPDGTKVAVGYGGCGGGAPNVLFLSNPSGSPVTLFPGNDLTSPLDRFDRNPSWSPDGSKVAYSTVRWGNAPNSDTIVWISVIRADGGGVTPLTPPLQLSVYDHDHPTWSPDGRQIAYTRSNHIWLMDSDGSHQQPITAGSEPDWQTLPPPPPSKPAPPVQSLPATPTASSTVAKDARCQRFPKIIRNTTAKMLRAQKASQRAKTLVAKRAAIKRLRKLALQRKRYRVAYRVICR